VDHEHRILDIPGSLNTRDLGGLPVEGGGETQFGRIIRGPGVDQLGQPGVDALIDQVGITRELDLRDMMSGRLGPESLLANQVEERHHIPANDPYVIDDLPRFLAYDHDWDHGGFYLGLLNDVRKMSPIFELLADESERPTYAHCSMGKDRAGMVSATVLSAVGVNREAVVEDYALTERDTQEWYQHGIATNERFRKLYEEANPASFRGMISSAPKIMEKMLVGLDEQYGSPADYIQRLENGPAILEGLHRKLLDT
jgi:protein-tyrosine phosphatase